MTGLTPEQILQAARNTVQAPRNTAPAVRQALQNEQPKLTGDRCRCGDCGLHFGSTYAFDRHRVGPWEERRCLAAPALSQKGWRQDDRGFWRTPGREAKG